MKIGLDFDNVIAQTVQEIFKYYNNRFGKNHKIEEVTKYEFWSAWGTSKEEAINIVDEYHEEHKIEELPPLDDAVKSINSLAEGNSLFVITARPSRFKSKTEDWIMHHIKTKIKVMDAGDFHKDGRASKSEICKELQIPIILEDAPDTALDCADENIKVVLFDQPWNRALSGMRYLEWYQIDWPLHD